VATRELKSALGAVACDICQRSLLRGSIRSGSMTARRCTWSATCARDGRIGRAGCATGTHLAESARGGSRRAGALAGRAPADAARKRGREESASAQAAVVDDLPHHVQAVPSAADAQIARALGMFNASEHARTIAGCCTRSEHRCARACARGRSARRDHASCGAALRVRFEVDFENGVVRQSGQGYEHDELGRELPPANVSADEAAGSL